MSAKSSKAWLKSPDNLKRHRTRVRANSQRKHKAQVELLKVLKAVPCADCGVPYPWYIMQFDHIRGVKLFEPNASAGTRKEETILAEIAKCDVVCPNCHALRTWARAHREE
jgi:hypothetical protein